MDCVMSLIATLNSKGLRTAPCGTPFCKILDSDNVLPRRTLKDRFERKLPMQYARRPRIPHLCS
ncbi:hypothetical protein PGB90_002101 [Kerria lacca]